MTNSIPNESAYRQSLDMFCRRIRRNLHVLRRNAIIAAYFIILLAVSLTIASAQGKISGVLTDAESGETLIGANVIILGTSLGAASDLDGAYFILNIPAGKYDLQASIVGYQKVIQTGVIVNSDRTTTVDFKLVSESVQEKPVIIIAVRPDVEPEKTSTSEIIRTEDIQQLAGMRTVEDVLGLAADVQDGHFRGGREGEELYILQGMGITNPLDNTSAFLPIMSAVEEVEVITSGFGAQYGNAQSGVVNISMKEGKSDKWRTRAESRVRLPGLKHFGPSVYDPKAHTYLNTLMNPRNWFKTEDQDVYYRGMFDAWDSYYAGDSLVQAAVAYLTYLRQSRRDVNLDYSNQMDYSLEIATGGPLDENLRMFVAIKSNTTWPKFPTEKPDIEKQVMGNIAADIGKSATIRVSGGYSQRNLNVFPSINGTGFYNWVWDRISAINYRIVSNSQIGVRFTHALSSSTFYEIKINTLFTKNRSGSNPTPSSLADSLIFPVYRNLLDWNRLVSSSKAAPDGFGVGRAADDFRNSKTSTISLDASISSQVSRSHFLNAGIQANSYYIDVSDVNNVTSDNRVSSYSGKPYEIGVYAQDKMEFQGMIANVGLRLDAWDQNSDYYTNQISPFRYDSSGLTNSNLAPKNKTPMIGRLQPRVGFSFPVSVTTVFHLNYGSFMQRPSFQYILRLEVQRIIGENNTVKDKLLTYGNARIEPEITNSYDIGVTQGLGEGFTFDVSGYYKDVKNQIQQVTYEDRFANVYNTYMNRDYADIRGFRFALNKKRGDLTGTINYQYSVATGKSSTPTNASPIYREDQNGNTSLDITNVPLKEILLDFDRTHNVIITLGYSTGEQWGPQIGDVYPLCDMYVSLNSRISSGQPYTYVGDQQIVVGERNNKRTPTEYNTNIRLTKRIRKFFGTEATFYFEVFNLFDNKILNYDYIFDQSNANTKGEFGTVTQYETRPIDAPDGLRYQDKSVRNVIFSSDHSSLIYSNSPRSFNVGMVIDF